MDKIPFKEIEKYRYGLQKTVSKHLKLIYFAKRADFWICQSDLEHLRIMLSTSIHNDECP